MTKARLIKALDGLPDDTRILISGVRFTDEVLSAEYVQIDNDGSDGGIAEVTLLGVGKKHTLVPTAYFLPFSAKSTLPSSQISANILL